jgi:protein-tyrosine phosphatase
MYSDVYWIGAPIPGRLAIMARPRAGDWFADEVAGWKAQGVEVVVSLLEREEIEELGLRDEADLCQKLAIAFTSFPVPDRGVPSSARDLTSLVHSLKAQLEKDKGVAIHCRAGIGRSSVVAACVLHAFGIETSHAFELITTARRCAVPDTERQREWVVSFAHMESQR